jgi:hypothetical protein
VHEQENLDDRPGCFHHFDRVCYCKEDGFEETRGKLSANILPGARQIRKQRNPNLRPLPGDGEPDSDSPPSRFEALLIRMQAYNL